MVVPAGVPRKPGMTRDDLFNINAGIVRTLAQAIAEHAPKARPGTLTLNLYIQTQYMPRNQFTAVGFRSALVSKGVWLDGCHAKSFEVNLC